MSLPAMAIVAALIALEKPGPRPERIVRLAGAAGILEGVTMLALSLLPR